LRFTARSPSRFTHGFTRVTQQAQPLTRRAGTPGRAYREIRRRPRCQTGEDLRRRRSGAPAGPGAAGRAAPRRAVAPPPGGAQRARAAVPGLPLRCARASDTPKAVSHKYDVSTTSRPFLHSRLIDDGVRRNSDLSPANHPRRPPTPSASQNATATAESRTAPGSTANYRSTTTLAAACRHISFVSNTAVSW
jgi:hypothetical protein